MSDPLLDPLLDRFPEHREELIGLFQADTAFQELCEDYSGLHRMVVRLRDSPEASTLRMLMDFESLLQELYDEVRRTLDVDVAKPPPKSQALPEGHKMIGRTDKTRGR